MNRDTYPQTLAEQQEALATAIRYPHHGSDFEQRRLAIYQSLFFNNVCGFLTNAYPVLHSLYDEEHWEALLRIFFQQHVSRSPFFVEIAREFLNFLVENEELTQDAMPYALELAHYEWLELDVSVRKHDVQSTEYWQPGSRYSRIKASPLATLGRYSYPVHQISREFQPQQAGDAVCLLVFRNRQDTVAFTLLNSVTAYLWSLIDATENGMLLHELENRMCQALIQFPEQQLRQHLRNTLETLLTDGVLLPADA